MLFIPRQVALVSRAAAAAGSMANDERKKVKKSKSNKAKGSASAATAHVVGSIAAFLKSHGFPRTLAALQSEANLEGNGWELSSVSLEDLFSRFLDSSHGPTGVRVDGNTKQDPSMEKTSEETHKKKKKKGGAEVSETEKVKGLSSLQKPSKDDHTTLVLQDETKKKKEKRGGVEVLETETKACEQSTMEKPGENGDGTTAPHDETKESKRKKKSSSLAVKADDGQTNERGKNNDQEIQLQNPDDGHKKKGKKQKLDDDVEARLEQVGLAIKNKYDAAENLEEDRKKKSVEDPENCKESESQNDTAGKNGLGNNAPQDKGKKKKKGKSTSEKLSSETSNRMDAGTAPDEVGGNSDGTKEKADIVETKKSGNEKKSKKKRKKSNSEENVMGEDEEIAGKDLVARPNDENKGRMEISNTENSRPESENTVVGKKRKLEEVEGSTPPTKGDLSVCDQNNQKLSNGFAGDDAKEKSTVSKPSKRQKHSSEPKTVNAFQRVKLEDVKFANERLQDNSYWAKGGADSGYGAKAQEVLGQVRGRDFRHEKTKKKRGSYRGGQIDLQTHSIKFNYSDDE